MTVKGYPHKCKLCFGNVSNMRDMIRNHYDCMLKMIELDDIHDPILRKFLEK